jgi:hypothetical protein
MAPDGQHGDPLAGHPKYLKIQDLNRGAFGFVQVSNSCHMLSAPFDVP